MKICLVEPFYSGSHAAWAEEFARYSRHDVELLILKGRHWKWRMHGGAVTLARQFMAGSRNPDLLLVSDMLDLTTFLALTRTRTSSLPIALYCHENQLTYPWSPDDSDPGQRRDAHYAFINYTSALAADAVLFNSQYHLEALTKQLPAFLGSFPDHIEPENAALIKGKSVVLPLGMDLRRFDQYRPEKPHCPADSPLILWNHRWEYDKNPEEFFQVLFQLQEEGLAFKVAILGESYRRIPPIFAEARRRLGERIVQFGYAENFADYARWLWRADLLPVHSVHDFFGASVIQAIYCNCLPLLPRRLAYPEHLPAAHHDCFFYADVKDLTSRLRLLLQSPIPDTGELRTQVQRYDWQQLVGQYDDLFEMMYNGQSRSSHD
ncbi:MAG: tRNA-queuosine alpha-mannosyltransferase domain-containing protein [Desulfuromonadales bacterium]